MCITGESTFATTPLASQLCTEASCPSKTRSSSLCSKASTKSTAASEASEGFEPTSPGQLARSCTLKLDPDASLDSSRPSDTVIVFDWDDTLLPTSLLRRLGTRTFGQEGARSLAKALQRIERSAGALLELALTLGRTVIVTNADPGWVEFSARQYLPKLASMLERIPTISARGEYAERLPGQKAMWKERAFLEIQTRLDLPEAVNFVSVGDLESDMDAVRALGRELAGAAFVKTIKLRERPSAEELWKQLDLVCQRLEDIVRERRNLKVCLHRRS